MFIFKPVGTPSCFRPQCLSLITIIPISPRVFSIVGPCVTSDMSDMADWTWKALGGVVHFIMACWDL